jgi:hypothetical protein
MGRRLGELLVRSGRLQADELDRALREQRVSGGTLGTHLVRLGFLSEADLSEALADIYGVPAASRESLEAAPEELLGLLSPEFARRHLACPFREDEAGLHVALGDPSDLLALQEAAFLAGRRIAAHAAPEFLIHEVLVHRLGHTEEPLLHRPGDEAPTRPQPEPDTAEPPPLARLGERLAGASSRDEVLDAVLEDLSGRVPRGALLALRAERAVLWRSCGFSSPQTGLEVSLQDSGVLAGLREGDTVSTGPLSASEADAPLLRLFPDAALGRILVLPIYLKQHPVAVFLGDLSGIASPDLSELSLVSSLTATALEVVILRQKILRATGAAGRPRPEAS